MAFQTTLPQNYIPSQVIPYIPQFPTQRYAQIENNTANYLKGRPVTSIEEARVAQIDFDGTLNIFTDIANKRIYTKQINMDGTSSFNIYTLTPPPEPEKQTLTQDIDLTEYVTKNELDTLLKQVTDTIAALDQRVTQQRNVEAGSKF